MNKLKKLRKYLRLYNIDGYIIPKNDEFFGEYVEKTKDRLKFISNFSGSAGQALVLLKKAYLFVDGRYTIQAKKEVEKSFKVIEIHKKKPSEILNRYDKNLKIGFDPKIHSEINLIQNFRSKNTDLVPIEKNFIDLIYPKNLNVKIKKFFIIKEKHVGISYKKKLRTILDILKKNKLDSLLVTAPENIAWILNIRGKDSEYSPIPNCHAIISRRNKGTITLIVDKRKIDKKFKLYFKSTLNYISPNFFVSYLNKINKKEKFLIDKYTCSYFYKNEVSKRFKYEEKIDPIYFFKSKKNKIEINNLIKSHIADGVALTKFIYWIKKNINNLEISEISASKELERFRKKNKNYRFPSFNTISGSGPNGAIVHYRANQKTNRIIKKNDVYLCDSGGQYHYGTTDVTRTMSFSNQPKKIKDIFTRVLKGHIGVYTYNLNKKTTGKQLDAIARSSLRKIGLDYAHGTGHGVGYFLNVHEGPQSISKFNNIKLEEGMVLSNEPGYYEENKFGIRIENLIYIKKINKKLKFENLTLAPIENDLINSKLLNYKEKKYLNEYHKKVYQNLSPYLNKYEKTWLRSFFS